MRVVECDSSQVFCAVWDHLDQKINNFFVEKKYKNKCLKYKLIIKWRNEHLRNVDFFIFSLKKNINNWHLRNKQKIKQKNWNNYHKLKVFAFKI